MSNGSIIAPALRETQAAIAEEAGACPLAEQIPLVIEAIESTLPTLDPQTQRMLLSIFTNPPSATPFDDAMKTLVLASPVLTAFSRLAAKESEVRHAVGGPFLFWALSKSWSSKVSMEDIGRQLKRWTSDASGGGYTSHPMAAGFLASVALPLLDTRLSMSTAKKRKLHAAFFDAIQNVVGFSKLNSWSTALTHPLMINLGHLAQSCNTESCRYTTVRALWDDATKKTMGGMRAAGQEAFLASVLASNLSTGCKLGIAMQSETHVWLEPSLVPEIAALLPVPEKARLAQLNWPPALAMRTTPKSDVQNFNQLLVSTYCPDLNVLLDLSLSPEEWCDPAIIMKRVRAFTAKTTTFELPVDMEFSP